MISTIKYNVEKYNNQRKNKIYLWKKYKKIEKSVRIFEKINKV